MLNKTENTGPNNILHNLPQPQFSKLIGMDKEIELIKKLLSSTSNYSVISIDGIGGAGKTSLALESAIWYQRNFNTLNLENRFDAIIWVSAKVSILTAQDIIPRPFITRTLEDIYATISIVLNRKDITKVNIEKQHELVKSALADQRTLLIVDNLDTIDDRFVNAFLRELPTPTKAIVTTRVKFDFTHSISLSGLKIDDAVELISYESRQKGVALTEQDTDDLYRSTGGIPLAIIWTLSRIAFGYPKDNVINDLKKNNSEIIRYCFSESLRVIREENAYYTLLALSLFDASAAKDAVRYTANPEWNDLDISKGLVHLQRLSLVAIVNGKYNLLPLTRNLIKSEIEELPQFKKMAQERWLDWEKKYLLSNSPLESVHNKDLYLIDAEYFNIRGVIEWCLLNEKWEDLLELTSHSCLYLYIHGLWQELLYNIDIGLLASKHIGSSDRTAWLHLYAVLVYLYTNDLFKAEISIGEAEKIINNLEDVSEQLLESLNYRQITLKKRKKQSITIQDLENSLNYARESNDPSRMVGALCRLSDASFENKREEASKKYLVEALSISQNLNDATLISRVLSTMSSHERKAGNLLEAKEHITKALTILDLTQPVTSLTTAYVLLEAARVHFLHGDNDLAQEHADFSLDIFSRLGMETEISKVKSFKKEFEEGTSRE